MCNDILNPVGAVYGLFLPNFQGNEMIIHTTPILIDDTTEKVYYGVYSLDVTGKIRMETGSIDYSTWLLLRRIEASA